MSEEVSDKTLTTIAKIKAKQWKAIGSTITELREFTASGGVATMLGDLKETWSLQVQDALSPLKNEITELVATALNPMMPMITEAINAATIWIEGAVKSWEAILTGQWDDFAEWANKNMSDDMKVLKNKINQWFFDFSKEWDELLAGYARDWKTLTDFFAGVLKDLGAGWEGFWTDVGTGWEGFWSDLGF